MEATAVSIGKAVLNGALGYAKSKAAEEMALQLGVEDDVSFITDELEMMQSFLMAADEERAQTKVLTTWVKHVRDVSYNVEDNLVDFEIHAGREKPPILGCVPRNMRHRRRIAKEVKKLKAKVEDVSNRNLRYRLIKDGAGGSKPSSVGVEQGGTAGDVTSMFGIDEAWRQALEPKMDLSQLITSAEVDLRVIAVWGTNSDLGKTSEISKVFDDPDVKKKFGCTAWLRLMRPFDQKGFLHSIVRQFYVNSSQVQQPGIAQEETVVGADVLMKMEKMEQIDLVREFCAHVSSNNYLIVIDDLSTIDEWHCIKTYFPDKKNRSRIVVATQKIEIASLCTEQPYQASELKQLSSDQILYVFHKKLLIGIQEDSMAGGDTQKKKNVGTMGFQDMIIELSQLLEKQKCLIVLDDLSSNQEWDSIKDYLAKARRVILTTREKTVAKHCSGDDGNMHCLNGLEDDAAFELFKKKVFKDARSFDLHPGMLDQANLILKKCDGLPLAISTIGGYLANKPKTAMEWRKLNEGLSAELEINPELKMIKTVLMRSYDGLPYGLKSSFLYLSIFPEDHIIQRKRVVRRWIAEGYSREMQHMAAEQVAGKQFDELLDRSMILPLEARTPGSIDSCQLHDLIREICVSKAREDNLVFTLEEGCSLGGVQGAIRHLAISSNWKRDKEVMQRMLDLSHIRSLTVFGEWRSFFICSKMRFVRVLDLEDTVGLRDHHLGRIGELLHLRYLSLRGCRSIFELPDSFANLRQLQTLDIRGTLIWRLPVGVTKLQKLQYLHASGCSYLGLFRDDKFGDDIFRDDIFSTYRHFIPVEYDMRYRRLILQAREMYRSQWLEHHTPCVCCVYALSACNLLRAMGHLVWRPQRLEHHMERTRTHVLEEAVSRHDICNLHCYFTTYDAESHKLYGIKVPRGISKLKALHTLRDINVAWGNAAIQELGELTQLRKLGVVGVIRTNNGKFWPAIAEHNQLRSLSVDFEGSSSPYVESLDDCLGGNLMPPKCLESLKMRGMLIKVTEWVHWLQNLSKLQLQYTQLNQEALEAIGKLPNLVVLRLSWRSILRSKLCFPGPSFPSILVLELSYILELLEFERNATPNLEVLVLQGTVWCNSRLREVSGLEFLTSLKEIRLDSDRAKELVQSKLAEYSNNVTIKML
ncbi:hypothetical protein PVAP13_7NG131736 [Panicum virgatum]|uniref:Disease resistance protein RPM1 n=1 Tax=Panicum virgatum TaxID=38727 RepID=A0A8T0Q3N2_PANVG|nr:hypothetical protein PVAP13_7NG131736 [Panicum virgatum]